MAHRIQQSGSYQKVSTLLRYPGEICPIFEGHVRAGHGARVHMAGTGVIRILRGSICPDWAIPKAYRTE